MPTDPRPPAHLPDPSAPARRFDPPPDFTPSAPVDVECRSCGGVEHEGPCEILMHGARAAARVSVAAILNESWPLSNEQARIVDVALAAAAPVLLSEYQREVESIREADLEALRTMSDLYREAVGVPPSKHQTARLEAMAQRVEVAESRLSEYQQRIDALREPRTDAISHAAAAPYSSGFLDGWHDAIEAVRAALGSTKEEK